VPFIICIYEDYNYRKTVTEGSILRKKRKNGRKKAQVFKWYVRGMAEKKLERLVYL